MEELNQVLEEVSENSESVEDGENLFSDFISEESSGEQEETAPEVQEESPFMTVHYNKEERGLSQEEAIEYAQKGMNYDKVLGRYNDLNGSLERLANMNGMSVDEFINSLNETQTQLEINNELDALKEQYPEADESILSELAETRARERINSRERDALQKQTEQVNAEEKAVMEDIERFQKEFPDIDINNIPKEIMDYVKQGYTLTNSAFKYQHDLDMKAMSEYEAKSKIDKFNEDNKKKSYGDITNAEAGSGEDDFFKGLNSI